MQKYQLIETIVSNKKLKIMNDVFGLDDFNYLNYIVINFFNTMRNLWIQVEYDSQK